MQKEQYKVIRVDGARDAQYSDIQEAVNNPVSDSNSPQKALTVNDEPIWTRPPAVLFGFLPGHDPCGRGNSFEFYVGNGPFAVRMTVIFQKPRIFLVVCLNGNLVLPPSNVVKPLEAPHSRQRM